MRLLDQLLDRAVSAIPAELHEHVVIFGSAPMVFAGLKPDVIFDLDLFVSAASYRALLDAGFAEDQDERGLPRIIVAEAVEGREHMARLQVRGRPRGLCAEGRVS